MSRSIEKVYFTTTPSKSRFLEGEERYIGQLRHNRVRSREGTVAAYAEYKHISENEARTAIGNIGEFIAHELAQGNRVDMEYFEVWLKLGGGFGAANQQFDASRNKLTVEMAAKKKLKAALGKLKPVNTTDDGGMRLTLTHQLSPYSADDEIAAEGERLLTTSGNALLSDVTEGEVMAWVENDAGVRLLTAEIIEKCDVMIRYRLNGPIIPGLHWLVVAKRQRGVLMSARRRLAAVMRA